MKIDSITFQLDTFDFHSIAYNKGPQTSSINDQMVNILGFTRHMVLSQFLGLDAVAQNKS